ncbi:ribosomal protection-like ABC-F family protein [Vagococcus sp. JNUCC 83]
MKQLEIKNNNYHINANLSLSIPNLTIEQGDKIGLIGKNGSGKTTLLHILANEFTSEKVPVRHYSDVTLVKQFKEGFNDKSGGEKTQRYLQEAFKKQNVWLLDEPTTNLDDTHVEWVEKKVLNHQEGVVVVSHDRYFLTKVCNEIWHLKDGELSIYKGNYQSFLTQYEEKKKKSEQSYEIYSREKEELEEAIRAKKRQANGATSVPKNKKMARERTGGTKPYYAKKQKKLDKSAKALETRLSQLTRVDAPKKEIKLTMETSLSHLSGEHIIIRGTDVSVIVGKKELFSKNDFYIKNKEKVAIIGKNGVGKTTLLRMILTKHHGIQISPSVKIGYFSQEVDLLETNQTILENVLSTSRSNNQTLIRTVLARMSFYEEDIVKPVSVLSGGERVKVTLAKLLLSDINTLILDEPTNYLDINALNALEELLLAFDGTVIFVSHDRHFVESVATKILAIEEKQIHMFEGNYNSYLSRKKSKERAITKDELLVIETKITEVLGKLSLEVNDELEKEFQLLVKQKQAYKKTHKN